MKRLILLLVAEICINILQASTITVTADANWSAIGAGSSDDVIVANDAVLTIDVTNAECASLQLGLGSGGDKGNGTLSFSAADKILTVNGLVTLGDGGKKAIFLFTSGGKLVTEGFTGSNLNNTSSDFTAGTIEFSQTNTLPSSSFSKLPGITVSSGVLTFGDQDVDVYGDVYIDSDAGIDFSDQTIDLMAGDWNNQGSSITMGTGKLRFYSGGEQTIYEPNSVSKVVVSNNSIVTLLANLTLTTALNLSDGKLRLSDYNLIIPSGSDITSEDSGDYIIADDDGYVVRTYSSGSKTFVFSVGDEDNYSPITVKFTTATSYGDLYINVNDETHSALTTSGNSYITRWWEIDGVGFTGYSYNFDATYVDADIVGTESNIYGALYSAGDWYTGKQAETDGTNMLSRDANTTFSNIGGGDGGALPVKLIDFTADRDATAVKLIWHTSLEVNNDYFTIERTQDGENFELVAKIKGAGDSRSLKEYVAQDPNPLKGMTYYRLKQTDFDGKHEYFEMVGVMYEEDEGKDCVITIYPNPCMRSCVINLEDCPHESANDLNVELFDLAGNKVMTHLPLGSSDGNNAKFYLNTENVLSPGIFVIGATNKNKSASAKVVVG